MSANGTQHVVIVDDYDLNLRLLRSIAAEIPGVMVHPFLSSRDALEWCDGKDIDCFVLDYQMQAPDGVEMVRILRATEAFAMVPIVIVTGDDEREVRYRAFDAGANDFVSKPVDYREMVARISTLLELRAAQKRLAMQIGSLEASLLDADERSREHAERLEALWKVANNPNLHADDLVTAMLAQAAAAIRPGQPFLGLLGRIEGTDIITDAVAGDAGDRAKIGIRRVGACVPLARTIIAETLQRGGTQSWDDMRGSGEVLGYARECEWRAVISTHFTAGGTTHALTFASTEPASQAFHVQDHRYVEVLAQFFATRLQQQWQAVRIRHQLEHDTLTGLWNRSRFRSLGRAAFQADEPCAVAVIDIVDFHAINECHGHLIGDAVLVEVAAALAAEALDNEIVARVGGDSFAVLFSNALSREWVLERIARFGAVFEAPIGVGDREGKEWVLAAGSVGIACATADGTTLDDLLFRAEARSEPATASRSHRFFRAAEMP